MRLENYISDLLYRYQCVIVPGFGAFLTRRQPARADADTAVFYPPSKNISFNVQLSSNDGLLANYITDVKKITYDDALRYIEKEVTAWEGALRNGKTVSLKHIGELWTSAHDNIQFQPSYTLNYLESSFGLAPVMAHTIIRETLKQEVEALEATTPVLFTPEKRRNRNYLRYAAIFLLLIATSTTGYRMLKDRQLQQYEMVQQQASEEVEKTIQQATFFDADPATLPSVTLSLNKIDQQTLKYHVVGGAFRIEANADKKIDELTAKGYNARKAGVNRYGLHIVSYGSFAEANEALSFLRAVRQTEIAEAWLWVSQ